MHMAPPPSATEPAGDAPASDRGAAARLLGWTAVALLGTAAALAGVLVLANRDHWWRGLLAAGVVSTLSAGASLPPLVAGLRRGMNQRLVAYVVAAGARAAISLGGCLLAVTVGGYPASATLLLMVVFYFAVLAVETTFVARSFWHQSA